MIHDIFVISLTSKTIVEVDNLFIKAFEKYSKLVDFQNRSLRVVVHLLRKMNLELAVLNM